MRSIIVILMLILGVCQAHAQWGIENGHILPKNVPIFDTFGEPSRFVPTMDEVMEAEKILDEAGKGYGRRSDYFRVIKKRKKYYRQYYGYFNEAGEKCILINYIYDPEGEYREIGATKYIVIYDGGDSVWNTKVNLETREVISIDINGEA